MQKIACFFMILFLVQFVPFVSAQEKPEDLPPVPSVAMPVQVDGTVNCFDYYKFGSVQVDVEPSVNSTVSGTVMNFNATIKNDNEYPIVDGAIYAKIFKKQADQDNVPANGNDLIDQFFVKENITLNAKENQPFVFEWRVPGYATTGDYQIAMFFTSAKKFNLLGLSFTDDVVGNTADFSISGEIDKSVTFNKNSVDINGENYRFAAYPPRYGDEEIKITAELINTTDKVQNIPVTWKLYAWDGQLEKNIIDTKKESVQINPAETKKLLYIIAAKNDPVYYLVAEAQYKDAKSILDIRTVRANVNKVRINFPSITNYPLKKGEQNTLFACTHNSGVADVVDNNKLVMTVLDENQKEIHAYTYEGRISGAMMGLKDDFTPQDTYGTFTIKSELYTDNKLVDSVTMKYDCNEIDQGLCPKDKSGSTVTTIADGDGVQKAKFSLGIIFFLIFVITVGVVVVKKYKNSIGVFLILFIMTGMLWNVSKVDAKSVVWSSPTLPSLCNYYAVGSNWSLGLSGAKVNVMYGGTVRNMASGQEITDGTNIPVGTVIKFFPKIFDDTDISWFGTGNSIDSPYGTWRVDASAPGDFSKYYVNTVYLLGYNLSIYIPLSIIPPNVTINQKGTASLSCNNANDVCTVLSAGSIVPEFMYSATYGKFYYAYTGGSYGTQYVKVPMREGYGVSSGLYMCNASQGGWLSSSDYMLSVPQQSISFQFNAVAIGNPPTVPTLTGPVTGRVGTKYDFIAIATDPDGDDIRYGYDWDNDINGSIDQWMPSGTYVVSGENGVADRQWSTTGNKMLRVKACDQNGNCSAWSATHTIEIVDMYPCTNRPEGAHTCPGHGLSTQENTSWTKVTEGGCNPAAECQYFIRTSTITPIENDEDRSGSFIEERP